MEESHARVTKEEPQGGAGPRCPVCRGPVRTGGAGQKPTYCEGRRCSSKAYRARVKARQEAALAAVLDETREPPTDLGTETARHLARLGEIAERTARRLARDLDAGADPMVLGIALASLTRAAESLATTARTAVRQAKAEQDNPGDNRRDNQEAEAAPDHNKSSPQLLLDTRISALSPYWLGATDRDADLGDDLVAKGWTDHPNVVAVERHDQQLAWIENSVGGRDGWAVLVNGRFVADTDYQPVLSATAGDAIAVLRLALRQQLL
ncbi:hypothetical protein [Kitasatospora sp. NPDC008115]|uniref:hypothetical protein n=1 Tax=Kitasatospora sp. NPDC008115 TaxID=3364022 RepID=UPI0036E976A6